MITSVGGKTFAEYLAAIRNGNTQYIRIRFTNQNVVIDEHHISISGLQYNSYLNPEVDIAFGTASMAQINVDLINKDGTLSDIDFTDEFIVELGVDIDGSVVYQSMGVFIGEQPDKTHGEIIHLTGLDRMKLFEIPSAGFFSSESTGITLADYYEDICQYCGVTAGTLPASAVNTGRTYAQHPISGDGYTCRDILASIAEAMGCYAVIDREGVCRMRWFADYTQTYSILQTDMFSREIAEYTVPAVEKVQVKVTDNDVGVIVPADSTNTNGYVIVNNPFLLARSDSDLRPYVTNLYNQIHGFGTYIPATIEIDGTWLVEPGDIVRIQTGSDSYQNFPVFSIALTWKKVAMMTLECTGSRERKELTAFNKQNIQIGSRFHEVINDIDELRSTIGSFSYSTNYVQFEDPSLEYEIHVGDTWTQYHSDIDNWGEISEYTWEEASKYNWGDMYLGIVYAWDGTKWIVASDMQATVYNETMIDQTSESVALLASKTVSMEQEIQSNTALIQLLADQITLGVTAKGVITEQSFIEIMSDHVLISSGGYVDIRSGGSFTVNSGAEFVVYSTNLDIDASGLKVKQGVLVGSHYDSNGDPLLTRSDVTISSYQPTGVNNRIWVKPVDSVTTNYTKAVSAEDNMTATRTYYLSGKPYTVSSGTFSYTLKLPVACSSTSAVDMSIVVTLSNGTSSFTMTGTMPKAYYAQDGLHTNFVATMTATNSVWLGTGQTITITVAPNGNYNDWQKSCHLVGIGTITLTANYTGSSGAGWKPCDIKVYQS